MEEVIMDGFFIPLSTLLKWCDERNGGDAETFGIMNPEDDRPLENWPIGIDGQNGLEVCLSLQDIFDDCEENLPGYPLDKVTVFIELEGDGEDGSISSVAITEEAMRDMQRESQN